MYNAIPWNGDTSKMVMPHASHVGWQRDAFLSPAYNVQTRRPDHATNQAVSSKLSDRWPKKSGCPIYLPTIVSINQHCRYTVSTQIYTNTHVLGVRFEISYQYVLVEELQALSWQRRVDTLRVAYGPALVLLVVLPMWHSVSVVPQATAGPDDPPRQLHRVDLNLVTQGPQENKKNHKILCNYTVNTEMTLAIRNHLKHGSCTCCSIHYNTIRENCGKRHW